MSKYLIDIHKFITLLEPTRSATNLVTLLQVLLEPFRTLHALFISYITEAEQDVLKNGIKGNLEIILNDLFDKEQRRIYITDGYSAGYRFDLLYSFENPYIIPSSSVPEDFIVYVPTDFSSQESYTFENPYSFLNPYTFPQTDTTILTQIEATVNKYKILGKNFKIILI